MFKVTLREGQHIPYVNEARNMHRPHEVWPIIILRFTGSWPLPSSVVTAMPSSEWTSNIKRPLLNTTILAADVTSIRQTMPTVPVTSAVKRSRGTGSGELFSKHRCNVVCDALST